MSVERLWAGVEGVPEKWNLERIGYPEQGEIWLSDSGPKIASADIQLEHPVAIIQNIKEWAYVRENCAAWIGKEARFRDVIRGFWIHGTLCDYRKSAPYKWRRAEDKKWYRYAQFRIGTDDAS